MIVEELTQLGLTDKEAQVYLILITYGAHPSTFIAKKAELNRGTTYQALHSLLDKGLVSMSMHKGAQIFSALDPSRLEHLLVNQSNDLARKKKEAETIIAELETVTEAESGRPSIEYFDGIKRARQALMETLNAKNKMLYSYLSLEDMNDFLGLDFLERYTDQRIKKGYSLKTIRALVKDKTVQDREEFQRYFGDEPKFRRQVRHVPDELVFPVSLYLHDETVTLFSTKYDHYALTIHSKEFSVMQRRIFEILWEKLPALT